MVIGIRGHRGPGDIGADCLVDGFRQEIRIAAPAPSPAIKAAGVIGLTDWFRLSAAYAADLK